MNLFLKPFWLGNWPKFTLSSVWFSQYVHYLCTHILKMICFFFQKWSFVRKSDSIWSKNSSGKMFTILHTVHIDSVRSVILTLRIARVYCTSIVLYYTTTWGGKNKQTSDESWEETFRSLPGASRVLQAFSGVKSHDGGRGTKSHNWKVPFSADLLLKGGRKEWRIVRMTTPPPPST